MQLLGALGLFLFGMKVMSDALQHLAGNAMRSVLAGMTSNRLKGIGTGLLITAVIQSSSATTLMVVSFANASLLSLTEAISVIMGANIGTTITAWLITLLGFEVSMSALAIPVIGIGFGLTLAKRRKWQQVGSFVIGFGLLFLGLEFLKLAMPDLGQQPELLAFLQRYTELGFGSVLLFLGVGTLLTIVLQSSSATMALTLVMTAQGWIPYELAAAMVLGENIGTTITANLASLVGNYQARQTARAHLIFNLLGVVWMLGVFYPFLEAVAWLSGKLGSGSPYLEAGAIPVAISLFHTSFNVCNTLLMVWLVHPLAWLVRKLVPERAPEEKEIDVPKFLNDRALKYPQTAIAALEEESRYLYEHALFEIVTHALHLHRTEVFSDRKPQKVVRRAREDLGTDVRELYIRKVKHIYSQIIAFAVRAEESLSLNKGQLHRIMDLVRANRRMVEVIRDAGELNRNVTLYLNAEPAEMAAQYDGYRKKVVKVLRSIYDYSSQTNATYDARLERLAEEARRNIEQGNLKIDALIRNRKITPEMASSLVNDDDNVNDMIQNLIGVAQVLYPR
ncbi:Na/Pi symporter [Robiginitalea sp. M366]|uniref:Na/Pi cotransporter family protein n=1 Tax=Robiginitalea aestuariiviva TaxID=3036903 RepID=UPI00240E1987|nr:Na/Pi symporter [Robiginitalea aestuariiviva]MDG1571312.1 Na/Pi symporter [Robiginitalea aestuariiviva]